MEVVLIGLGTNLGDREAHLVASLEALDRDPLVAVRAVSSSWDLETSDESALTFSDVTTQFDWMEPGIECKFRFGQDPIMHTARIQRSSGVFGGQGIDSIIYQQISGVEIQITGGEAQN